MRSRHDLGRSLPGAVRPGNVRGLGSLQPSVKEHLLDTVDMRRATIETWTTAWSEPDEQRRLGLLGQAVAPICTYTDPHTDLVGYAAISGYMGGFQESAPGARFVMTGFSAHHNRCLLQWNMVDRDGQVLSPGASAGVFDEHGRLVQMTGFFAA